MKTSADLAPIRVLIIDDDVEICELTKTALARAGCHVMTASDGSVALGIMDLERFDAILTDVKMARMSGIEFLTNAINDERNRGVMFFAVSGHLRPDVRAAITAFGGVTIVEKPFDPDQLAQTVVQAVRPPQGLGDRCDPKLVRHVSAAIYKVMASVLNGDVAVEEPRLVTGSATTSYVTSIIPLALGERIGTIMLPCSKLFLGVVGRLALGERAAVSPELTINFASELLRSIAAGMTESLAECGQPWRSGRPHTVVGDQHKVLLAADEAFVAVPIRSSLFPTHTKIVLSEALLTVASAAAAIPQGAGQFRFGDS